MNDVPLYVPSTGRLLTENADGLIGFDEALKLLRPALGSYRFAFDWLIDQAYLGERVSSLPESQTVYRARPEDDKASVWHFENWEILAEEHIREIHDFLVYHGDTPPHMLYHDGGTLDILYEVSYDYFTPSLDSNWKYMIRSHNIRFSQKQIREWSGLDDFAGNANGLITGSIERLAERPRTYNNTGRPKKHDWEGALIHIISIANKPDGIPAGYGANTWISDRILEWFADQDFPEPMKSEVGLRASRILKAIKP